MDQSLPMLAPDHALDASFSRDLINAVEGEVRIDPHNRLLYATDASLYQVEPLAVVIPSGVEDAARALRFCAQRSVPVLMRGGGTSLAGQCTNRAVVIDMSVNCRRVLPVNTAARTIDVDPGVTVDDLNDAIAPSGLFFAPDPATSRHANIGGCIGNNAAGARSIRYLRTSENVVGIDACLASGARVRLEEGAALRDPRVRALTREIATIVLKYGALIRERFPRTLRRSAGYQLDVILRQLCGDGALLSVNALTPEILGRVNLSHLLCGSEGTLAMTLGATLRLHPRPRAKGLITLSYSSLDAAIEAVLPILATNPTAVELLDDTVIDLALANAEYRRYAEMMPAPADSLPLRAVLYVEYFGDSPEEVSQSIRSLEAVTAGVARGVHLDGLSQLRAWKLRKAGEPLLHGIPGNRKPITFVEDNAVPVENLAIFVREFRAMVQRHGTVAAYYAHASVGVLHIRPLIDIHSESDRVIMRSIATEAAALARSLGGVMSGEHGDGRVRTPFLLDYYGTELMQAFREVKRVFDPHDVLNPGNIVDLSGKHPRATITEHLRVEPRGRPVAVAKDVETYFDYTDQHGLDGAVEMCNGAGVCRKKQGGTMCPSYMATLDERHATRGRGNALRLAITGQLGTRDRIWDDPGTMETLNLCLSCKACKTECPSNVDIARLKAEYAAQRYRTQRPSIGVRLMGEIRRLNRLGAMMPRTANALATVPLLRGIANAVMGLDPRRSLPPFARSLARQWPGDGGQVSAATDLARVALFGDCFTMFNEPRIGLATQRVLTAFGYDVLLSNAGCCGRAKISLGLLAGAIDEVDGTLRHLLPLIEDDSVRAILVAEPSCLSAIKDDWLSLKLSTPIAVRRRLAAKAFLPEDFLHKAWESHPRRPVFRDAAAPALLHGHCHQKALWGSDTSANILRRVLGEKSVKVLDTGCCGMAGSFGFSRDRYELSMKIGGLTLFPALRDNVDSIACAPGTSCRHQIHDGVGRTALHPMELLASLLDSTPTQ